MKKFITSAIVMSAACMLSLTAFANYEEECKHLEIGGNKVCSEEYKKSTLNMLKKYFPCDFTEFFEILCNENADNEDPENDKPSYIIPETPETETPEIEIPEIEIPEIEAPETEEDVTEDSSYQAEVIRLVNQERAKYGLSALSLNESVQAAAYKRAEEIRTNFTHTRPNGTSCFTVLGEYGVSYSAAGENIAMGQDTPAEVVSAWMNSAGHRKNILSENFTQIGIGYLEKGGTKYWTQLFIG